jgi:hypothetical protein
MNRRQFISALMCSTAVSALSPISTILSNVSLTAPANAATGSQVTLTRWNSTNSFVDNAASPRIIIRPFKNPSADSWLPTTEDLALHILRFWRLPRQPIAPQYGSNRTCLTQVNQDNAVSQFWMKIRNPSTQFWGLQTERSQQQSTTSNLEIRTG